MVTQSEAVSELRSPRCRAFGGNNTKAPDGSGKIALLILEADGALTTGQPGERKVYFLPTITTLTMH